MAVEPEQELYEIEVLDGELVEHTTALTEAPTTERSLSWIQQPTIQTAAAAATGFVAGAATFALLSRYATRIAREVDLAAANQGGRSGGPGSRRGATYVVHVRQIISPEE